MLLEQVSHSCLVEVHRAVRKYVFELPSLSVPRDTLGVRRDFVFFYCDTFDDHLPPNLLSKFHKIQS
jgi:hypothetical protein